MSHVVASHIWENQANKIFSNNDRQRASIKPGWMIVFCVGHIPLALLINQIHLLATVHALATLAVGLVWALKGSRYLTRVVYTCAYISGSEVLWRIAGASIFWEFGKYAVAVIFLLAMFRSDRLKGALGPLFYFLCLLPSCVLTIQAVGWDKARDAFSFNLSGPFALFVCAWFFSNLRLSTEQVQNLLLFFAAPILGIAGIAQYAIHMTENIRFTSSSSNLATSGGFGPNQVSAILGLGALIFFLFITAGKTEWGPRIFAFAAMLFLAAQSALTFSRGGLYNVVGSVAVASIYFIRNPRTRARFLPLILIVVAATFFVILPQLDSFTSGTLSARFQNTDTTNRADIAMVQLQVWLDNPILGVGPGQTRYYAGQIAHTEFTRLLAEHGIFGVLALLSLLFMAVRNLKNARTLTNKALAAAMLSWNFLFMMNAGMRLVAPSFAFGLSFLLILAEENRRRFCAGGAVILAGRQA